MFLSSWSVFLELAVPRVLSTHSFVGKAENANLRGSITAQLTSCLTGLDLTKLHSKADT